MMKSKIILVLAIITLSCSPKEDVPNDIKTPAALDNNRSLTSYDARRSEDIIQRLYEEALSKDEKLRALDSRLEELTIIRGDSLEESQVYLKNNEEYWNTVDHYLNQFSDTIQRQELKKLIHSFQDDYNLKVEPLNEMLSQINRREQQLKDREIIMKILVTHPMMSNYQKNEYPDSSALRFVKARYDALLEAVKPYTQIRK